MTVFIEEKKQILAADLGIKKRIISLIRNQRYVSLVIDIKAEEVGKTAVLVAGGCLGTTFLTWS